MKIRSLMESPDYTTCKNGKNELIGEVFLKCNLWGKGKVAIGEPQLCVYEKEGIWGWKWEVPDNARGVIGYPALQIGVGPWGWNKTKIAGFPLRVSNIEDLQVNYDVESYVKHRKYNLSFDLWLVDSEEFNPKNIKTEIMIWEDYFDFSSYGKKKEVILTPFGSYKVLEGYLYNPNYKQDWQYIAFVRTEPRSNGNVDIGFFLNYLVEQGMIQPDHYLTSVEFGNEIGNSSGFTLVNRFEWTLKTNN